jgi:hypothetical protein
MAESVDFQLKLQDLMSAALKGAAESALKLENALDKVTQKTYSLEKGEVKVGETGGGMFALAVAGGELLADSIEKITEKVFDLGKELIDSAIEVSDFGYKAEVAFRHLYGEVDGASAKTNEMMASAHRFAMDVGAPVEKVTEAFLQMKRAGLGDEWLRPLTAAAGDLAGIAGHPEAFSGIAETFARIGAQGGIDRALRTLTASGVQASLVSKHLGLGELSAHQLMEHLSKHPVSVTVALRAMEEAIQDVTHAPLGSVWLEQSKSIEGTVGKVKAIWETLLDDVLNKKGGAFEGFRESFGAMADHLRDRLPALEAQFSATFGPIITALDKFISDPDAIKRVFDGALFAIETIAKIIPPVVKGLEWIAAHLPGQGPQGTFTPGAPASSPTHGDILMSAIGHAARGALGHGAMAFAEGGPVHDTGMAMVHAGEFVVPAGGALVRGSGGGHSIDAPITINVHVEGGEGMTEDGLSLKLSELLPNALIPAREQLASTIGAA